MRWTPTPACLEGKVKSLQIENFQGQPNFSLGKKVKEVFREELEGVGGLLITDVEFRGEAVKGHELY